MGRCVKEEQEGTRKEVRKYALECSVATTYRGSPPSTLLVAKAFLIIIELLLLSQEML